MSKFSRVLALLLAGGTGCAWGLDPGRALTQYVHRIWQLPDELSASSVYTIWQTHDAYLWLGTQNGPLRFDGTSFVRDNFVLPKLPRDLWIRAGVEGADGNLWLGTNENGVYRVNRNSVTQISTEQGLPSNSTYCLTRGAGADLWVCTANGLAQVRGEKVIQVLAKGKGLITSACIAKDGSVWLGRSLGRPMRWANGKLEEKGAPWLTEKADVRAVLCGRDGTLWIGGEAGLLRLNSAGGTLYTVASGLPNHEVISLLEEESGDILVGTRAGIARLRNGQFDTFTPGDGLSQSMAATMFLDREGSLWVGTKLAMDQFVDGRGISYTESEGMPSNNSGPVLQDAGGTVWAGTLDAGLARLNKGRFQATKSVPTSDSVIAMSAEPDGRIWIGTTRGLLEMKKGAVLRRYTTADGLPAGEVRYLYRADDGRLWVGTSEGLAVAEGKGFRRIAAPPGEVEVIAEDGWSRLMIVAGSRLYRKKGEGFEELGGDASLRKVTSILRDPDGNVWIGTRGEGLRLMRKDSRVHAYFVRDGLFDGEIDGFLLDDHDRLWMPCGKGVFWVPRRDLLRLADGKLKKLESVEYARREPARGIEARRGVNPVAWKMQDGSIWFSTIHGLMALNPDRQMMNAQAPPLVISDPVVNGRSVAPEDMEKLPPGTNDIQFTFAGLSYVAPVRMRFKYMLEGYDRDWVDAGVRREAFYTNLPPGKFRFRVVSCNRQGACSPNDASISFRLTPHWYERASFWVAGLVGLGLTGWGIYRQRVKRLRERYDLIVSERSRIARELHDTLIQGFSGVTMAMQALSGRMRTQEERRSLQEIIDDAAMCLRQTRRSVAGLREGTGIESGLAHSLASVARSATETKDIGLDLRLDLATVALPAEVEYNVLRIAGEAIANAVQHAEATRLEVWLRREQGNVELVIADNGRGFDVNVVAPGHYGVVGMKERASQIGAALEVKTEPGGGTTVRLAIPVMEMVA